MSDYFARRMEQIIHEHHIEARYRYVCGVCGKLSQAWSRSQKYCSDECRQARRQALDRKRRQPYRAQERAKYVKPENAEFLMDEAEYFPEINRVSREQRKQEEERKRRQLKAEVDNYPNPFRETE